MRIADSMTRAHPLWRGEAGTLPLLIVLSALDHLDIRIIQLLKNSVLIKSPRRVVLNFLNFPFNVFCKNIVSVKNAYYL